MTTTNQPSKTKRENGALPDWIAKSPKLVGRKERFERVGAAWNREDGICLRLHGNQIVSEDIYLFPNESRETE